MKFFFVCLLTLYGATFVVQVLSFTIADEERLRDDLFTTYTNTVRPSPTTDITLALWLTSIDTVDIKNQWFGITGWWSMRWTDARLSWSMASYGNIPVIQVYPDTLWTPALVVDNSVDDLEAIEEDSIPLRVMAGGTVTWNPPAITTVSCDMDITYFPFEKQTCAIQVTSFGYSIEEVDITVYGDGIDQTHYGDNGRWDLLSTSSDRDTYEEDGYTYSRVYYYFTVERKPLYYGLNLILPVLVLAMLTCFVFLLPADSGEKTGFCLTVLLAFMVILTLIAVDLPQTAKYTCILEVYIALVLILGGLSVMFSICVLYVHHLPDKKKVPKIVKKMAVVAMYICCRRPKDSKVSPDKDSSSSSDSSSDSDDTHRRSRATTATRNQQLNDPLGGGWTPSPSQSQDGLCLYKPQQEINRPTSKRNQYANQPYYSNNAGGSLEKGRSNGKKDKKKKKKLKITWQLVASLMDGILFRVYALILVSSSLTLLIMLTS